MWFNLVVILLILFLGFHFKHQYNLKCNTDIVRKRFIIIISFVLVLQSGLRNMAVGTDTYNYFWIFNYVKTLSWSDIFETSLNHTQLSFWKDPGYMYFQKIIQYISGDFQVYLFIIAILFFSSLGYFLYKNTSRLTDLIIAFVIYEVLFYTFFSITGIRQTIATAATLYSFELVKKRKLIPFIILILLASTIHISCLIFLPIYFVFYVKRPALVYGIVLILFPIFFMYRHFLMDFFRVFGGYEKYNKYASSGTLVFTTMFLLIAIAGLWRSKFILKHNPNSRYYFIALAIAVLFIPLTWVNPTAMRILLYFSIFMLLLIPEIIHSFNYSSINVRRGVTVFVMIILLSLFIKSSWNAPPYGFFWETMPLPEVYLN
ncbi:MAG: EpsG family protein [Chitinophagaceae bacterium]|nr:MAG: EpsG family protein [Chitinophagaceae bacterium]